MHDITPPSTPVRGNLPTALTKLVGREPERAEVARLLAGARLLTLTGAGGVGKTRLALDVATTMLEGYVDGVWLVEFAPLTNPELVTPTVATVLGVREQVGRSLAETLASWLASRRLLLVLDNCEHLIAACAWLADALLRGCPSLQILATSREALGITGEVNWRVPSLPTPPSEQTLPLDRVTQYAAVQLFLERATAAAKQ